MILIFGRRIPEIMGGIGRSLSEFRKGVNESFNEEEKIND
jgi:Sec-independent protein translocase protein TatA